MLTGNDLQPAANVVDGGALAEEEEQHDADRDEGDYHRDRHQDRARSEWHIGDRREIVQSADAVLHQFTC